MKKIHIYLFSSIIYCKQCEGAYRGIFEGENKYICSNYSNQNICSRRIIKESDILHMVEIYCQRKGKTIEYTPKFMIDIIERIIIKDADNFDIYYGDFAHQYVHEDGIKFI